MTTIQDRANLITGLVADAVTRQIQEAVNTDPVRVQLAALFTEVIDGVYIGDEKISREELTAMPLDAWAQFLASRRPEPVTADEG